MKKQKKSTNQNVSEGYENIDDFITRKLIEVIEDTHNADIKLEALKMLDQKNSIYIC